MISILQLQLILACTMLWGVDGRRDPCMSNDDPAGEDITRIWPAGIVPYQMNNYLSKNVSLAVEKEIQQWEFHSCIKFVPHNVNVNQRDFVFFDSGDKNCAFFGKIDSGQLKVSFSHSVSTNKTALNIIFAKMIGIRNSTLLFTDSLWSHDLPTASNDSIKMKRSNSPNVTTSAQSKRSPLCNKINACGHSFIINSDNGLRQHHIKSPGYPHGYSNKMDCVWSIYNSDRRPISISFKGSSLEVCHRRFSCDCDFVGIITIDTEGDQKPNYSLEQTLCSSDDFQQKTINTNVSKIIIQFHSDVAVNDKGLLANITWGKLSSIDDCSLANGGCEHICVPATVTNTTTRTCKCNAGFELSADDGASCEDVNECEDNNGRCSHHCVNTMGSYYCTCKLGYSLSHDNVNCRGCRWMYRNQKHVVIKSPHYPGLYSAHHNCVWKIESETPQFYKLTINRFDLNYSLNCTVDSLKITDKTNKLNLPRLCGAHVNRTIISRTAELTIHFKTRVSGGTGFHIVYHQLDKQPRYIDTD